MSVRTIGQLRQRMIDDMTRASAGAADAAALYPRLQAVCRLSRMFAGDRQRR
jgi:hypothetical protein